ncbi:hypothetical protein [Desulfovibrio oxyclinae]|jgi:hypothetical protein|uniref:hypothetical protein n=1 Tax=Desulfovibrio oxyclinae TaxID=63560 RepID=UPI00036489C0|nr:hypothetical protein [Desulfovibrio oxyclinae]
MSISPKQSAATQAALSRRFLRNLAWLCLVGLLFAGGQAVRWFHLNAQSSTIDAALEQEYRSVLGDEMGSEPYGRLQFEAGKLQAERKIGLDPLRLMAALSRNDTLGLQVYSITVDGLEGRVEGEMIPGKKALRQFMKRLEEEDSFTFELERTTPVAGAVRFAMTVGRR